MTVMNHEHNLPWNDTLAGVWSDMTPEERNAYLDAEGEEPPPGVGEAVRRAYEAHRRKNGEAVP